MRKTDVRKALVEAAFNPNEHGLMKVITDTHNPDYYEQRAIEAIHQARSSKKDYELNINQALGLLALAKVFRRGTQKGKVTARAGANNPGRDNKEVDAT